MVQFRNVFESKEGGEWQKGYFVRCPEAHYGGEVRIHFGQSGSVYVCVNDKKLFKLCQ